MTKKTHRLLKGTLYAQVQDLDERRLSLKYALLAAILLEVVLPIIIFNFDWSVNLESIDPLPHQAMSVLLDVPPDIDESSAEKITKKTQK